LWKNSKDGIINLSWHYNFEDKQMDESISPGRFELRDDQWERIESLLPGRPGHVGDNGRDNRKFVNAALYRYRAGIPWRDLPEYYGDFRVIHTRHMRWSRKGVWQEVFQALAVDADNEWAEIDSTIVRAHQHSAGGKKR
jgi:transposase